MTTSTKSRPHQRPTSPARNVWLWVALGVIVALAAAVAVLASGESTPTSTAGLEQTRSVEVDGAALAPLGDGADPAVGQPIPSVRGASFDGTPVSIGGGGEATVVAFLAHWCPHCQLEVPLLTGHLAANPLPDGIELVAVSTSTSPDRPNYPPSVWLDEEGWPGAVLADSAEGAAAQAFGLTAFPYFVAVDSAGTVVARTSGEISTDQFDALVQLALGGDGS